MQHSSFIISVVLLYGIYKLPAQVMDFIKINAVS